MLGDIEEKIRELDSDRSIQFEHRNKEKELNELHDDYNQLGNFCDNVGDVVKRHFDKPFLEDMDKFAGKIRDLSLKNYKTENRIGSTTTTTTPAAHRSGQVQTTTTKKDEITVEDIFKDSVAFDEVLQAQYKEIKMQNPDLELNYEKYRELAPSMRGFDYETIAEGQQKLEFWRDLAIAGALIILTITVPPLGIATSVAFGGLELKSAIEGKDWGTGRELNTTDRVGRGAFGALDMIPLVGPAAKSFRAMDSFISMSRLAKVQGGGVKFNPSKIENVVQSMQNSKNHLFGKLRLKTLEVEKYGNNKMYDTVEKIARKIDEQTAKVPVYRMNQDGTLERVSTNLEEQAHLNRIDSNRKIQDEIDSVGASLAKMQASNGIKGTGKLQLGKEDLDLLRKKWNVPETHTIAVGKTDVKGLGNLSFEGGSPKVRKEGGLPSLDEQYPNREIRAPYNRAVRGHSQFMDHAEEGVIAEFEAAVKKAKLEAEDVKGTLYIHQSNPNGVCNKCTKGLFNSVPDNERGIFKQLTDMYPNLKIKVSTEIDSDLPYPRDTLSFEVINGLAENVVKIRK
ncbi:hypothetical protein [Bacillus manliponensis]|uniref:hypothetical protein n=1 Tax=Bacillus manliponensis TaxID=574376 RepID=UPI0039F0A7B9